MRRSVILCVDLIIVVLSTVLALLLRDTVDSSAERLVGLTPYVVFTALSAAVFLVLLGVDRAIWRMSTLSDYFAILGATVGTVVGALVVGFSYNRLEGLARSMPVLQGLIILFSLLALRILARVRHGARSRPSLLSLETLPQSGGPTVLIVGINRLSELYLRSVLELSQGHVKVAGILGVDARHYGRLAIGQQVLGAVEDVARVLNDLTVHGVVVDRIVVTLAYDRLLPSAQAALRSVEDARGIEVHYLAESLGLAKPAVPAQTYRKLAAPKLATSSSAVDRPLPDTAIFGPAKSLKNSDRSGAFVISQPVLETQAGRLFWRLKRLFDVTLALTLVIVLAPVWLAVALIVAFDVGLPVAFWQERPGLGGRPFRLYKFRTMARAHDAFGRRMSDERRLSGIGRFLRRTRLDELPQLLNIIAGDMSFVGPRPLLPADQSKEHSARLLIRPGLKGWAQVNGGRDVDAADKAALDVWYVVNACWTRDLEILVRTVPMVMHGERTHGAAITQAWCELEQAGTYRDHNRMRAGDAGRLDPGVDIQPAA